LLLIVAFIACTTTETAPPPIAPDTDAAAVSTPAADVHAAGGGHMAQMAATRDRLRAELGDAYDQPVPGLDAADAAQGKGVYDASCASCHGDAGNGDGPAGRDLSPPAADFTDAFHARYYSDAGRVRIIEKGSPDTAMAGFETQLDRQQILDVYAYVRSLRAEAVADPTAAGHDHGAHDHGDGAHTH
jgi:high-affinity iron transporter